MQVAQSCLEQVIHIIGQVEHDKLPLYLNVADIFCLSSNSEGMIVMFEALGIGVPYVGTDVGGIPEVAISEIRTVMSTWKQIRIIQSNPSLIGKGLG